MFFGSVALIALILASVMRRPLRRLVEQPFRALPLLWVAIGLHLLFVPPALQPVLATAPWQGLPRVGGMIYILSLSLLVAFTWLNRRTPGVPLVAVGLLMNTAVIASNGGQMPVDAVQLAAKGRLEQMLQAESSGEWSSFSVMKDDTRLSFLGDWLPVPMPFKGPEIMSLGDLVIAAGIVTFFFQIPGPSRLRPRVAESATSRPPQGSRR